MGKKLSLKDAEQAHKSVITSSQGEIADLYTKWAKEIAKEAKKYKGMTNASAALKEQQLSNLKKVLTKTGKVTAESAKSHIKDFMLQTAQNVVSDDTKWLKDLGFPNDGITAAFGSIPTLVVESLVAGQVYESGWSLSKSIWSDNEDTLKKAYEIVAGGVAENKSVYAIAKDLEQFVDPNAKKPWNYTFKGVDKTTGKEKTYRVYSKKVDYNAQRLARTLSQHAYQQTTVTLNAKNPFVQKFRWHSSGRACPICKARNGKLYDKDKVPLDHPCGMCYLEPIYDDNVNQRLADWVNGSDDEALDEYASLFGDSNELHAKLKAKAAAAKAGTTSKPKAQTKAKAQAKTQTKEKAPAKQPVVDVLKEIQPISSDQTKVGKKSWNSILKAQTRPAMLKFEEDWESKLSSAEKKAVKAYTRENQTNCYVQQNGYLRFGRKVSQTVINTVDNIRSALSKSILEEDTVLVRGTRKSLYTDIFKGNLKDALDSGKYQDMVGESFIDPGFLSTSPLGGEFSGDMKLVIYAPKGTQAGYVERNNVFGEKEMIVQANTQYLIEDVEQSGNNITIYVSIIGQ